jgi:hypothetical protein
MKHRNAQFSATAFFALGLAGLCATACSEPADGGGTTGGAGGTTGGTGGATGGTGGTTGGTGGTGGTTGGTAGTGGTTGGTGGTTGGTAGTTGGTLGTTGGMGTGGTLGTTGGMGAGGAGMGAGGAGMGAGGGAGMGAGGGAGRSAGGGAGMPGGGMGAGGMGTAGQSSGGGEDDLNSGPNTMGWVGCSMANNVAEGYARIGGTRMWGGYGNGGAVVQNWTNVNSSNWNGFDDQVSRFGMPKAVWMMICVFTSGATMAEIKQMIANTKTHAPGAYLYISGQPLYHEGHVCTLAGDGAPEKTDMQAQQAAMEDPEVHYVGPLGPLNAGEYAGDSCHTNTTGGDKIGRQVKEIWGQP